MKAKKTLILFAVCFAFATTLFAQQNANQEALAKMSLFHTYHAQKDFKTAEEYGWYVINNVPEMFLKYKPFKKMEDILWYIHDSVATTPEMQQAYYDTTIYFYDKAIQYKEKNYELFFVKKAYIVENWSGLPADSAIVAYEWALENYPEADSYYKDRLGILYTQNATEENGYKLKALDLYNKLSEAEPSNETWNQRLTGIAENIDELVEITKRSWDLQKDNLEKAWKYASVCMRAKEYEKAIDPLEFLVTKSPQVVNYWRQLALSYQKIQKWNDAIRGYKTLIDLEPDNRENYFNIALVYQKIDQLSVARSYLQKASKASKEPWGLPVYTEGQLYEQAARNCGFEFMDKCVYQLAVECYLKAARMGGATASTAKERAMALKSSVPQQEDYFFRKLKSGQTVKIEGKCYDWINRSITIP